MSASLIDAGGIHLQRLENVVLEKSP